MNANPPLAQDSFLFGHLRRAHSNILQFFLETGIRNDVAELDFKFVRTFLVSHPDAVQRVLVTNQKNYSRHSKPFEAFQSTLGKCLFTNEGDDFKESKRRAAPLFQKDELDRFKPTIQKYILDWIYKRVMPARGQDIQLSDEMGHLSLRILMEFFFQKNLPDDSIQELFSELTEIAEIMHRQSFYFSYLGKRLQAVLSIRKNNLLKSAQGKIQPLAEAVGMDLHEAFSFLTVGSETTGGALAWFLYLLAKHPDSFGTLKISNEEKAKCLFLESMRLYPPGWKIGRVALNEDILSGFTIPKGSLVIISPWVLHRHPKYWADPEVFQPVRFLNREREHSYQYIPFGAGPRVCIGNQLALSIAHQLYLEVQPRLRFSLTERPEPRLQPAVTLRPKSPLYVRVSVQN